MRRALLVALPLIALLGISACQETAGSASATTVPQATSASAAVAATATPKIAQAQPTPTKNAQPKATPTQAKATVQPTADATKRIILNDVSIGIPPMPIHVAGRAQVFEATVSLRLKDSQGKTLAKGFTMASMGAPEWGDFAVDMYYPARSKQEKGVVEVFEVSMKDGSDTNLVSRTVTLDAYPDIANWKNFSNPDKKYQLRYPASWFLNQGTFAPPPPSTIKLSTYKAGAQPSAQDAEVWISTMDLSEANAEIKDLTSKGYAKSAVTVGGLQGTRLTDKKPHAGVYDAAYLSAGQQTYRIHLSASVKDFDDEFAVLLGTFATIQ